MIATLERPSTKIASPQRRVSKEKKSTETNMDPVARAFEIIGIQLADAAETEENHAHSGDSDRLLRMASAMAYRARNQNLSPTDAESVAFDIAALIKAARLVPGDTEHPNRTFLIDAAAVQLNYLTGVEEEGESCIAPDAPRPSLKKASALKAAYTPDQMKCAMEFIAGNAATLSDLLSSSIASEEDAPRLLPAAHSLAQYIGLCADKAINHSVLGDAERWTYGPLFPRTGETA